MENYLAHFGILGMKWGVRRYQNPDGTLTEEGRRRYGKDSDDSKPSKKVSEMTDEELSGAINRMRNEKAYKDLMRDLYPEKVTLMDKIVDKVKNETIPNTVSKVLMDTTTTFVNKFTGAKIDEFVEAHFDNEYKQAKRESDLARNLSEKAQNDWLAKAIEDNRVVYNKDGKWVGIEGPKKLSSSEKAKQRSQDASNRMNAIRYAQMAKMLSERKIDPTTMKLWTDKAAEASKPAKSDDDKKKDKK